MIIARKYKQVHRKEIDFDIKEWEIIERRAEACHTNTSKYIRTTVLNSSPSFYDMKELAPLLNGLRIITTNINQIARKANETNNIYAGDVQAIKEAQDEVCRIVNQFLSTLRSTKV